MCQTVQVSLELALSQRDQNRGGNLQYAAYQNRGQNRYLKKMKNDKSPGLSGFSADFFKVFWKRLGQFVLRSINYGYATGKLSESQRQGIITCIPKENKSKQFLKNWRPLTLLDTVYKIASGTIANRLKQVLDNIISCDQTGFLKGRFIG